MKTRQYITAIIVAVLALYVSGSDSFAQGTRTDNQITYYQQLLRRNPTRFAYVRGLRCPLEAARLYLFEHSSRRVICARRTGNILMRSGSAEVCLDEIRSNSCTSRNAPRSRTAKWDRTRRASPPRFGAPAGRIRT